MELPRQLLQRRTRQSCETGRLPLVLIRREAQGRLGKRTRHQGPTCFGGLLSDCPVFQPWLLLDFRRAMKPKEMQKEVEPLLRCARANSTTSSIRSRFPRIAEQDSSQTRVQRG